MQSMYFDQVDIIYIIHSHRQRPIVLDDLKKKQFRLFSNIYALIVSSVLHRNN